MCLRLSQNNSPMQPPLSHSRIESPILVGILLEKNSGYHALQRLDLSRHFQPRRIVAPQSFPLPALQDSTHPRRTSAFDDLLSDESLELIWLPSQEDSSLTLRRAMKVLQSNKHLIIDRPNDFDPAAWAELEQASVRQRRNVWCHFPGEFDPGFQLAYEASRTHLPGSLRKIVFRNYSCSAEVSIPSERPLNPVPDPIAERGIFRDRGIEALHQILILHPMRATRVLAHTATPLSLAIFLEFSDGLTAHWDTAFDHPASLTSGWYLHGDRSGYTDGKCFRIEADGEIVATTFAGIAPSHDPFLSTIFEHIRTGKDQAVPGYRHLFQVAYATRHSLVTRNWETLRG